MWLISLSIELSAPSFGTSRRILLAGYESFPGRYLSNPLSERVGNPGAVLSSGFLRTILNGLFLLLLFNLALGH